MHHCDGECSNAEGYTCFGAGDIGKSFSISELLWIYNCSKKKKPLKKLVRNKTLCFRMSLAGFRLCATSLEFPHQSKAGKM